MASPGKVLIIVQNLPVPLDRRVWLEARALKEVGYGVSVVSPKGTYGQHQAGYEYLEGIHIYRYSAPPEAHGLLGYILEFVYCWLMVALLSVRIRLRHGFDVIHACNPPETYFLLALLYKPFGTSFVFDHHDLSPEIYLAKGGRRYGLLHRGLLWLERQTFRAADVLITTNLSHKAIAIDRGGVDEDCIFVVRSGPDFERLKIMEPEPALKDGLPYLACYLGQMCPQDGVDLILRAAQIMHDEMGRSDVKFVLMGGGPELPMLRKMVSDLALDDCVELPGRVSDHDLCRYLSTAELGLDPDPYSEWSNQSTMNKIMEYMAFGKPTVAFDLKENRYSAQAAAVYARPDDVHHFAQLIVDLLDDAEKREEMGRFALNRVRNTLHWDYSKPPLWAAYEKVFALRGATRGSLREESPASQRSTEFK